MNNQLRWAQDYIERYENQPDSPTEIFIRALYDLAKAIVADTPYYPNANDDGSLVDLEQTK